MGKNGLFAFLATNGARTIDNHRQRNIFGLPKLDIKINSKWMKDLSRQAENIELLLKNSTFLWPWTEDWFLRNQHMQNINRRKNRASSKFITFSLPRIISKM